MNVGQVKIFVKKLFGSKIYSLKSQRVESQKDHEKVRWKVTDENYWEYKNFSWLKFSS